MLVIFIVNLPCSSAILTRAINNARWKGGSLNGWPGNKKAYPSFPPPHIHRWWHILHLISSQSFNDEASRKALFRTGLADFWQTYSCDIRSTLPQTDWTLHESGLLSRLSFKPRPSANSLWNNYIWYRIHESIACGLHLRGGFFASHKTMRLNDSHNCRTGLLWTSRSRSRSLKLSHNQAADDCDSIGPLPCRLNTTAL